MKENAGAFWIIKLRKALICRQKYVIALAEKQLIINS